MPKRHGASPQHEGAVFLVGLFVLVSLLTLTAAGLTRSLTEMRAAQRTIETHQAFHLAEARLDDVLQTLAADPSFVWANTCPPAPALAGGETNCALEDLTGGFPSPDNSARQVRIRISGFLPTQAAARIQRTIEAVVQLEQTSVFQWAAFAENITFINPGFGSTAAVDGYDSREGPYPYAGWSADTPRPIDAMVRSNSTITILGGWSGDAYFWSHMLVGPGLDPATAIRGPPGTHIMGQQAAALARIQLPAVTVPPGRPTGAPYIVGNCGRGERTKTFTVGIDAPSLISTGIGCTVVLQGDGFVPLDDLHLGSIGALEIRGNIILTTPRADGYLSVKISSGSLQMYVGDGQAGLHGTALDVDNPAQDPTKFILYVNYAPESPTAVDLWNYPHPFCGAVYAPNSQMFVHNIPFNTENFGSLIAKQLITSYKEHLHYDQALRGRRLTPNGRPRLLSWRELPAPVIPP